MTRTGDDVNYCSISVIAILNIIKFKVAAIALKRSITKSLWLVCYHKYLDQHLDMKMC